MTAQVSTNPAKPTNNFKTNYLNKLRENIKMMVILFILHFIAAPVNIINLISYAQKAFEYDNRGADSTIPYPVFNYLYPIIGFFATLTAVLCGVIIAINIFNYYHKKSNVDMVYSLPLTTNQRFFSDFLAGITIYLAPYVLSCIFAMIFSAVGNHIGMSYVNRSYSYDNIFRAAMDVSENLIYVIIAGFLIMLMFFVLTVLILTCCGSLFECIAYTILGNALIPATIAVFYLIFIGDLYGINLEMQIISSVIRTSPVGGVLGLVYWLEGGGGTLKTFLAIFGPIFLITAGMFVLAWFLNRKRRPEQVAKPFAFKIFYYIIITCITFCISCLFTADGTTANIIPLIIVSAIVYLIFELITNRGFKKFHMSVIRYAATMASVLLMIVLVDVTNGFGALYHIPSANSVRSVTISPYPYLSYETYGYFDSFTFSDKENIQDIIDVHQSVLDRYDPEVYETHAEAIPRDYGATWIERHSFDITYHMNSGFDIVREYQITDGENLMLRDIEYTEEFITQLMVNVRDHLKHAGEIKSENYILRAGNTIDNNILDSRNAGSPEEDKKITEFTWALEEDMKAMSKEEFFQPTGEALFYAQAGDYWFTVTENHLNVLKYFQTYDPYFGFMNSLEEEPKPPYTLFALSPENLAVKSGDETLYAAFGDTTMTFKNYQVIKDINKEDFEKLMSVAKPFYVTDKPCYAVARGTYADQLLIIPEEYSYLIEKHYKRAQSDFGKFLEKYPFHEEGGYFFYENGTGGGNYHNYDQYLLQMMFMYEKSSQPGYKIIYEGVGNEPDITLIPYSGTIVVDGKEERFNNMLEYCTVVRDRDYDPDTLKLDGE